MIRYVANASDTNDVYSFFLPLVSIVWRKFIGYEPISLLYGSENDWLSNEKLRFILDNTKTTSRVEFVAPVPPREIHAVTKISRFFACALSDIEPSDYILTSDVDMIPLNRGYFWQQDMSKKIHLFGADAYSEIHKGIVPPKFPACYIGAKAEDWKDVTGISDKGFYEEFQPVMRIRSDELDDDEMWVGSKIKHHEYFRGDVISNNGKYTKGECHLIIRTWPNGTPPGRIDREHWRFLGDRSMIDCHAFKPGYKSLDTLRRIFEVYFPEILTYFDYYTRQFMLLKRSVG